MKMMKKTFWLSIPLAMAVGVSGCASTGADGQQHVLVLAGQAAVPALQQVLRGDGHLAPLTAEDLLHLAGEVRVRTVGLGLVLQGVSVCEHGFSLGASSRPPRLR